MRTAEQIKKDIEASEKALQSSQMDVARWQKLQAQLREELAALPPEPVKLRAETHNVITHIYGGSDVAGWDLSICSVRSDNCARHNISAEALAAHICAFQQPDPNAEALARLPLLEDVAKAARAINFFGTQSVTVRMNNALAALDSAKGWTDPNSAALKAADALAEAVQVWGDSISWHPRSSERANTVNALTAYRAARGVVA